MTNINLKSWPNSAFRNGQGNKLNGLNYDKYCQWYAELMANFASGSYLNRTNRIEDIYNLISHLDIDKLIRHATESILKNSAKVLEETFAENVQELIQSINDTYEFYPPDVLDRIKPGLDNITTVWAEVVYGINVLFDIQREYWFQEFFYKGVDEYTTLEESFRRIAKIFELSFYQTFIIFFIAEEIRRSFWYAATTYIANKNFIGFNSYIQNVFFHSLLDKDYANAWNKTDIDEIYRKALYLFTYQSFEHSINVTGSEGEFVKFCSTHKNKFELDVSKNSFLPLAYWFFINYNTFTKYQGEEYQWQYEFVYGNELIQTSRILTDDRIYQGRLNDTPIFTSDMLANIPKLASTLIKRFASWLDCNTWINDHRSMTHKPIDLDLVWEIKKRHIKEISNNLIKAVSEKFGNSNYQSHQAQGNTQPRQTNNNYSSNSANYQSYKTQGNTQPRQTTNNNSSYSTNTYARPPQTQSTQWKSHRNNELNEGCGNLILIGIVIFIIFLIIK